MDGIRNADTQVVQKQTLGEVGN